MSRIPSTFRQGDVAKAIRGAAAAGREVEAVIISSNGDITVVIVSQSDQPSASAEIQLLKAINERKNSLRHKTRQPQR